LLEDKKKKVTHSLAKAIKSSIKIKIPFGGLKVINPVNSTSTFLWAGLYKHL